MVGGNLTCMRIGEMDIQLENISLLLYFGPFQNWIEILN